MKKHSATVGPVRVNPAGVDAPSRSARVNGMTLRGFLLTVASLTVALAVSGTASAATRYTVQDLGTLGGSYSLGAALNPSGAAVGTSASASGFDRGFLFSHNVLADIGTLAGGRFAYATAINKNGQITGASETSIPLGSGFERHAFRYDHGQMTDLGTLGGVDSFGTAINDGGDVVGYSLRPGTGSGSEHAFLYTNGRMVDLGTLGASASRATGINNRGHVVGSSALADFDYEHGFFYSDGIMRDLGTLPGGNGSQAMAINRWDHVTGLAGAQDGYAHPILYRDGRMQDLGLPLGYVQGAGLALNDADEIVGIADTGTEDFATAFIYSKGIWQNLNSLIPPNSGWFLEVAAGINPRGQIVGTGSFYGSRHAFILTPR